MMNERLNYCPNQNPRKKEMRRVTQGNQDEFSHPGILFRKNVSLGHRKAGGEPHAWFSGSSIAFSASIILDGHSGLGNSRLSSEMVSVRSEETFESLDERELMPNALVTRRDIDEDITVAVLWKRCSSGGKNKCKDQRKNGATSISEVSSRMRRNVVLSEACPNLLD